MKIETIKISGLASVLQALRLPYNKGTASIIETSDIINEDCGRMVYESHERVSISPDDIKLLQTLIKRGDSHAKPMRGLLVYARIEAPIHMWGEIETYLAGRQRLFSASTMHTEGRGLSGHALSKALDEISFGRPVTKIDYFSYQCLRNMVYWRSDHRKAEWHFFIEWVKTLPLAKELILVGLEDKIAIHDEYMRKYNANEI